MNNLMVLRITEPASWNKLDLWAANTAFQEADSELITHHNAGVQEVDPNDFSQVRFGQIDVILCNLNWKNMVQDVSSFTSCDFSSDHFPPLAQIQLKFASGGKKGQRKAQFSGYP